MTARSLSLCRPSLQLYLPSPLILEFSKLRLVESVLPGFILGHSVK